MKHLSTMTFSQKTIKMFLLKNISFYCLIFFLVFGCQPDEDMPPVDEVVTIDTTPYLIEYGMLPSPNLPEDNQLTQAGVQLGKMLFYDKNLSKNESQACGSCHRQLDGFSDSLQFSLGVENLPGSRQAMPVFNLAWHSNEFFWDGRAELLREQVLMPIQDPLEMNETLPKVISKLSSQKIYRDQFIRTFGSEEITDTKIGLALEQFLLSIVSYQSRYDQYLAGQIQLTESEDRGRVLFNTEYNPFFPELSGADCAHCHGGVNFENDQYMNNGLDAESDFTDLGREEVTQDPNDRAKFKVPSLRNIAVTAPYMHDGRLKTLAEVIDHYNEGIKTSSTTDPTVLNTQPTGLFLDNQDKEDLINFLKILTDESFLTNPEYASPF